MFLYLTFILAILSAVTAYKPFTNRENGWRNSLPTNGKYFPSYEPHTVATSYSTPPLEYSFVTVTSTVTKNHQIRLTTTSDVWVTSAVVVPRIVTQYTTLRRYVPENPDTVTSVIRITHTPIVFETSVVENLNIRTVVSGFTNFVTTTETVEFWQPIVHYATSIEVVSVPVFETQTLLQVVTSTRTIRTTVRVTTTKYPIEYNYQTVSHTW